MHYEDSRAQAHRVDSLLGTEQRENGGWSFEAQVDQFWDAKVHNSETSSCSSYADLEESNGALVSYCNTISYKVG